jgi:hypothetical protein
VCGFAGLGILDSHGTSHRIAEVTALGRVLRVPELEHELVADFGILWDIEAFLCFNSVSLSLEKKAVTIHAQATQS